MPCVSDFMEPTPREKHAQRVAKLMLYARQSSGLTTPTALIKAADNPYLDRDLTPELCNFLRTLKPEVRDEILYGNPQDRTARELATWWEDHVKADEKREAEERKKRTTARVAWEKLSRDERKALGLDPDNAPEG